jgi:hypothetical protein
MDVPTSEVGYTSATTGRGDHEGACGGIGPPEISYIKKERLTLRLPNLFLNFNTSYM